MTTITKEILLRAVSLLNKIAHTTQANEFMVDWQYRRPALVQKVASRNSERTVIGRTTKGDLFDKVHILIAGIEYGRRNP